MVSDCYWNFIAATNNTSTSSACTELAGGCGTIVFNLTYPYTCSEQNIFCSEPFNNTKNNGTCT